MNNNSLCLHYIFMIAIGIFFIYIGGIFVLVGGYILVDKVVASYKFFKHEYKLKYTWLYKRINRDKIKAEQFMEM